MPVNFNHHRINVGTFLKCHKLKKTKPSKWNKIFNTYNQHNNVNSVKIFILVYILAAVIFSYKILVNNNDKQKMSIKPKIYTIQYVNTISNLILISFLTLKISKILKFVNMAL